MVWIIIGLVVLAVFGTPLFLIIGGAALASLHFSLDINPATLFTDVYRLTTQPVFVAVPLFIFSGYLLAESRVPQKMLRFTNSLLGWMPGGLCLVGLIGCAVFTAFTGASAITIVAVGALLYPVLIEDNYPENFSLGLITASGSLGTLLVPCLPLILYAVIASQQVPFKIQHMFIAGFLPAIFLILIMWVYSLFFGLKYARHNKKDFSWQEVLSATRDVAWELPLPFVVVGGILSGIFSAPEAAALAAVYVFIVQMFITRDMNFNGLIGVIRRSMIMNGSIMIIMGMALGLTNVFITIDVPGQVFAVISEYVTSKYTFLFFLNIFLLFVGTSMDIFSACAVIVPIIVPIAMQYGIDPIHLGIVFLTNLELGFITPPVGMSLFIASIKFRKSLPVILKSIIPFFIIRLVALVVITYIPELSLFLLRFTEQQDLIDPMDLL